MKRCCYQDCDSVRYPCGNITFFLLPTDGRRSIWIKNSGNKSLLKIGDKAQRFICENHFRESDINNQFTRKTLRKYAVPIEYISKDSQNDPTILNFNDGSIKILNEKQNDQLNTEFDVNLVENTTNDQNLYDDDVVTEFDTTPTDSAGVVVTPEVDDESNIAGYSLIDFYDDADDVPSNSSIILENQEKDETNKKEKQPDDVTMEVYLEENSNDNQVDSSTLELEMEDETQSIELFVDDDRECDVIPAKEKSPNQIESNIVETTTTTNNPNPSNTNSYEEDKHYALSLVGYFQRLPQAKKALAKLKILQYLTELEFDMPPTL